MSESVSESIPLPVDQARQQQAPNSTSPGLERCSEPLIPRGNHRPLAGGGGKGRRDTVEGGIGGSELGSGGKPSRPAGEMGKSNSKLKPEVVEELCRKTY
ncbi:hypothetical protein QQF64_027914, partial [Cirrhinus molitorella]